MQTSQEQALTEMPRLPAVLESVTKAFQGIRHHPKAGLNPLVDTAAYLFSVISKIKPLKSYQDLQKLHQELVNHITLFQDNAKAQGYGSEYVLVCRFALCATLDDIIANAEWAENQWNSYSLLTTFSQEASQPERFFMILERISQDPTLYIDAMEFMYVCLSLGFKGNYRYSEYGQTKLEEITHALYKKIVKTREDFTKK